MSPPLLGAGEEGNVALHASSPSMESTGQNNPDLVERNYMGLSNHSSADSARVSTIQVDCKDRLTLKATELRLGLPGSQSPERDTEICFLKPGRFDEKRLFPLCPSNDNQFSLQKTGASGNKRGFSDAMNGFAQGKFVPNSEVNVILSPRPSSNVGLKNCTGLENLGKQPAKVKEMTIPRVAQENSLATKESRPDNETINNISSAPAPKAQVVGWPPIRSFRKNSLATTSKNAEQVETKTAGNLFIKVSMDGAPYLRKVDLCNYSAYQELSNALEKMFSCFTLGQYESHGASGKDMLSESKLKDLLDGSEYVLTYEDKDGDWMLVGDVPWEMFTETCRRLRIMKSSDAIGLAPRAMEKSKTRS